MSSYSGHAARTDTAFSRGSSRARSRGGSGTLIDARDLRPRHGRWRMTDAAPQTPGRFPRPFAQNCCRCRLPRMRATPAERCPRGAARQWQCRHRGRGTLWSTYWLGLRGVHGPQRPRHDGTPYQESGVDIACRATNDAEATLRGDYVKVAPRMLNAQREPLGSFEHPGAFDTEWTRCGGSRRRIGQVSGATQRFPSLTPSVADTSVTAVAASQQVPVSDVASAVGGRRLGAPQPPDPIRSTKPARELCHGRALSCRMRRDVSNRRPHSPLRRDAKDRREASPRP